MGVTGLWSIIAPVQEPIPLNQLSGQRLAVDLSSWICEDMYVKYNHTVALKLYIRNLFFRVVSLLKNDVLVVGVTDGCAPRIKAATMQKRQEARFQKDALPAKSQIQKPVSTKRKQFSKISNECCDLLNLMGVPYVNSPGEAESMCALLNSKKMVDACITNDGDAFLYGADFVYRHFTMNTKDSHVFRYRTERIKSELGMSRSCLVALAMLLGCDYSEGVPGIGRERALRLIRSFCDEMESPDDLFHFFTSLQTEDLPKQAAEDGDIANKRYVRDRILKLDDFPSSEMIEEYLSVNKQWSYPTVKFQWEKPKIEKIAHFCRRTLDWEENYTLEKILPLAAMWELRHPTLWKEPTLKPLRIIKVRKVQFVSSYEIEWKRPEFDCWSEESNFQFSVAVEEFAPVYSSLVNDYLEARRNVELLKKKTKKVKDGVPKKTEVTKADAISDKMSFLSAELEHMSLAATQPRPSSPPAIATPTLNPSINDKAYFFSLPIGSEVKKCLGPIIVETSLLAESASPILVENCTKSGSTNSNRNSFDLFVTPPRLWDRLTQNCD